MVRDMLLLGAQVLDTYFLLGAGRGTWVPVSGFAGLLRCRWHGTLAQAVRQRQSARETVYWQDNARAESKQ